MAPKPPLKMRVNLEIDGPHVRLIMPDGTHQVFPLDAAPWTASFADVSIGLLYVIASYNSLLQGRSQSARL